MADVLTVDRDRCIGSGECMLAAPTVFWLDASGVATILPEAMSDDVPAAELERIVEHCPSQALHPRPEAR